MQVKKHKQTQGACDKTIPNFFFEYINKYGNEDKQKSLALGMAYGSFCHLASQTLEDQVEDVQNEVKKPETFVKRWGSNIDAFDQGKFQKFQIGKVYPRQLDYSCGVKG